VTELTQYEFPTVPAAVESVPTEPVEEVLTVSTGHDTEEDAPAEGIPPTDNEAEACDTDDATDDASQSSRQSSLDLGTNAILGLEEQDSLEDMEASMAKLLEGVGEEEDESPEGALRSHEGDSSASSSSSAEFATLEREMAALADGT